MICIRYCRNDIRYCDTVSFLYRPPVSRSRKKLSFNINDCLWHTVWVKLFMKFISGYWKNLFIQSIKKCLFAAVWISVVMMYFCVRCLKSDDFWWLCLTSQLFGEEDADQEVSPDTADPEAACKWSHHVLNANHRIHFPSYLNIAMCNICQET